MSRWDWALIAAAGLVVAIYLLVGLVALDEVAWEVVDLLTGQADR